MSRFLRNGINPLLEKYQCAAIVVHHTPKTNFRTTENWKATDWMYAGAGAADITNWARGVLVLDPTSARGVFKLIAAKRGSRIGWEDVLGRKQDIRYFSWVDKGIAWREATPEEIRDCNKKQKDKKAGPDQLLSSSPKPAP